ncbi:exopolysaccharide biosynthesis polyprenyl glycosylphosphotransferase [Idiomarina seosinensis]|uniref:Sugar transferase n=1 Tax=Idiomarina seosinensis TaxID=281739 RepID=A0A432ZG71_9GAMM|nr:exopolysaccharide biosynthesis polyprenyl glycosylphosphotransferase [Idiomarina seosinensis]RUO76968.1 sugar transferase [Idiomarina seosinensis]
MRKSRKRNIIHVYCPQEHEEHVAKVLNCVEINYVLNEFDLKAAMPEIVCHYRVYKLSNEEKNFLIYATEQGAWVEPLISYIERVKGFTEVDLVDSSFFLQQKAFSILSNRWASRVKRVFDVMFGGLALLLLLPLLVLFAIIIKLDSPGGIFYRQPRVGLFNKEFEVIKFRSMRSDAESGGAQWAQKNDPRVTRVGKFIRKTRIDELPQLINVLKGEMSLIGPRPERDVFVSELEQSISYYRFRHSVKPGITGLAQVKYPYGASLQDAEWKHRYDLYYIKNHHLWMDIKIAFLTVKTVLFAKGQ